MVRAHDALSSPWRRPRLQSAAHVKDYVSQLKEDAKSEDYRGSSAHSAHLASSIEWEDSVPFASCVHAISHGTDFN